MPSLEFFFLIYWAYQNLKALFNLWLLLALISKLLHFSFYLNNLPCREETSYFGDNNTTPYLYKGQRTLNFEQRIQLLLDVDSSKICHSRPTNVMENAAFVVDRAKLKNSEDWLVTDLGAFENCGLSARVFLINDDCVVKSRFSKGMKAERQQLQTGEYMVRNVFERHKYNDFNRTGMARNCLWDWYSSPLLKNIV